MNIPEKLREIDALRQAYRNDIATAHERLKELNIQRQNLIMAEE